MKIEEFNRPPDEKRRIRFIVPGYPTFNIYSSIARYTTALGPLLLASVVNQKPEWDVEVIDENNFTAHVVKTPDGYPDHSLLQERFKADVVALYGGLSSTIPRLFELARFYRERGCTVIAGGQHFFAGNVGEALAAGIDCLSLGEGERTIPDFLDALFSGVDLSTVDGLVFKENGHIIFTRERLPLSVKEIQSLPVPDFSLLRHAKISLYPVSWIRGCCMNCEFCTVKGNVRCPSADYPLSQVITMHERFGAKTFFIVDDLFGQQREAALEFCEKIAAYQRRLRVKFHFTVQIRLDKAGDAELLPAMRNAGIQVLAIGYESPVSEELKAMNKCLCPDDMIRNSELFHRAGFLIHGMFIFGYPAKPGMNFVMSAQERANVYCKFIRKARIDTIQILLPVPLPGTELTARLEKQRRIFRREDIGLEYYDGNFQLFEPDLPLDALEMQKTAKKLMRHFYKLNSIFGICTSVVIFPSLVFWLGNLRKGWHLWFRHWRNSIWRFAGWRIIRRWENNRNLDQFAGRLKSAQTQICFSRAK